MSNLRIKKLSLLLISFSMVFLISGCISIKTGKTPQTSGGYLGVYKSADATGSWQFKSNLLTTEGKLLSIGDVSINRIIMDPNDNLALYLSTDKGMYYSYDGAESWQQVKSLGSVPVNDIAVDHFNKCVIYVAIGESIYKSSDCLRNFDIVYFDKTRANLQITDIETEYYNKNVVYGANNKGKVLKSEDYGQTWQMKKTFNNSIKQILVDKYDSRIIYFATESSGLFKTTDGGATWSNDSSETDINKGLDSFYDSKQYRYLIQDTTQRNTFVYASKYGLLKTTDGGTKWESIELITPERGANIYSLAVDPKDNKFIYYGTDSTLYKSADGGKSWAPQKSPSSGYINFLVIDPKDSKIIYLGGKAIPRK